MSLRHKFFSFMIPSVISMWIFSLYTMADGIFVSWGVGPLALSAVNIAMPYTTFLFAFSLLFATGTSTIISICLGKGEKEKARKIFSQNIALLAILAVGLTVLAKANTESIAVFLGASAGTMQYVTEYLGIIFMFNFFVIISYNLEVMTRADGFPKLAACAVLSSAFTNIALDYLFVMRFGWGVKGAAYATGIAQVISTVLLFCHFLRRQNNLYFVKFEWFLPIYKKIIPVGVADCITEFSAGIVIFLFNHRILSVIGEEGVISYTVIAYINTLVLMTMSGISQGTQPLLSFHYGKEDEKSMRSLLKLALKTALSFSILWFLIGQVFTGQLVSAFISKEETILFANTITAFRSYSYAFLFMGVNVVLAGSFAARENPRYAISISLCRGLVALSICLYGLSSLFGEMGIWWSAAAAELLCVCFSLFLWRRQRQKQKTPVQSYS